MKKAHFSSFVFLLFIKLIIMLITFMNNNGVYGFLTAFIVITGFTKGNLDNLGIEIIA